MKLSKVTIMALKGSDLDFKKKLAGSLGITVRTLNRYIAENDDTLTKASSMEIIRQHTGLSDNEILEVETVSSQG